MKNFIQKNKNIIILSLVAIGIIVVSTFVSNKQANKTAPSPTPGKTGIQTSNYQTPSATPVFIAPPYSQPELNAQGQVDESTEKVAQAVENKNKLTNGLPIYIQNFKTSNGLTTTLNVYTIPGDPDYLIHIDIYGINYEDQSTDKTKNPDVAAFIDSFNEIKKQLMARGVDIRNVYFIFGERNYIQQTAELWIKTFGLL